MLVFCHRKLQTANVRCAFFSSFFFFSPVEYKQAYTYHLLCINARHAQRGHRWPSFFSLSFINEVTIPPANPLTQGVSDYD